MFSSQRNSYASFSPRLWWVQDEFYSLQHLFESRVNLLERILLVRVELANRTMVGTHDYTGLDFADKRG